MKIINNTSKTIICLIHEPKKKTTIRPFSNKSFSFYRGTYMIASLIKVGDEEYHDIWETLPLEQDGEITIGCSKVGNSGAITQVSSAEISTILLKNNGKSTLEIYTGDSKKPFCVLGPLGESWSWGVNAEGFRLGQVLKIKDSERIIDKIILDDRWISRIDFGIIVFSPKDCL